MLPVYVTYVEWKDTLFLCGAEKAQAHQAMRMVMMQTWEKEVLLCSRASGSTVVEEGGEPCWKADVYSGCK